MIFTLDFTIPFNTPLYRILESFSIIDIKSEQDQILFIRKLVLFTFCIIR